MLQNVCAWVFSAVCVIYPMSNKFLIQDKIQTFVIGQPTQKATWKESPSVRVCAETAIPAYKLTKALSYWKALGYDFGPVRIDHSIVCDPPRRGEIVFALPDGDFDHSRIASTKLYTHIETNDIVMAKIQVMPRSHKKERVLEHEIGHALGWRHYNQKFHMMNSNWFFGGYDSKGLRK